MRDTTRTTSLAGLGQRESGTPLSWRSPARIWTFGSRYDVRDEEIVWVMDRPHDGHFVTPDFGLLRAFVGLADPDASAQDVLAFARAWGMLGLCPHGLPRTHDPNSIPYSVGFPLSITADWSCESGVKSREQVDWWRYWAGQAAALASLIAAVRSDQLGPPAHWETLWSPGPWARGGLWDESADAVAEIRDDLQAGAIDHVPGQRDEIAGALDAWLRLAQVRVKVNWWSEQLRIEIRNRGLFDSIGLLLVFLAGDLEGFALCHACQTPFVPRRRLGPRDRARYCADCRAEHRPQREASRAAYRRKAADPVFRAKEAARRRASRVRGSNA
jgi:hypothetical protein